MSALTPSHCIRRYLKAFTALTFALLLNACTTVEPTYIKDQRARFVNTSASINILEKRHSRLLLDFEYSQASGSDTETRMIEFEDSGSDDQQESESVIASYDLDVESFRASMNFNVLNLKRASISVSPGFRYTSLERRTKVGDYQHQYSTKHTMPGAKVGIASQLNDRISIKGFGAVHFKSKEAGILVSFSASDWLDLELGVRHLDYDEDIFGSDTLSSCPEQELNLRLDCEYDNAKIEAILTGVSGGLHFKF